MILFLNVFITNQSITAYDRGRYGPPKDRLDVFKYSLASLAVLPWSAVFINAELDSDYAERRDELEKFVHQNFSNVRLLFERNLNQAQWQRNIEPMLAMADPVILFLCNDDHIFLGSDTSFIVKMEEKLKELIAKGNPCSCYISHWPEMMSYLGRTPEDTEQNNLTTKDNPYFPKFFEEHEDYAVAKWCNLDSIQLVSRSLLQFWWYANDYGNTRLPRTDSFGDAEVKHHSGQIVIFPKKEIFRHFDGYSHAKLDINRCPPLLIPEGFFENNIRISYCSKVRIPGYVHINPNLETYCFTDLNGADMRCVLEDLPLFWKSRISEIKQPDSSDRALELRGRNEALLRFVSARLKWTVKELLERFKFAIRKEGLPGELPLNNDFLDAKPLSYPWVYSKPLNSAQSIKLSLMLLDTGAEDLGPFLKEIRANNSKNDQFEILLLSVRSVPEMRKDWAYPLRPLVQSIIVHRQPRLNQIGTFSAHQVLNAGLQQARGSYLLFSHACNGFPANFIDQILEQISKRQAEENFVFSFSAQSEAGQEAFAGYVCAHDAIRKVGGFDEGSRFFGNAWSLKESFDRLKQSGSTELNLDLPKVKLGTAIRGKNLPAMEASIAGQLQKETSSLVSGQTSQDDLLAEFSDDIDDLAINLALGRTELFEKTFLKLSGFSKLLQNSFYTQFIVPFAQGNFGASIQYFEQRGTKKLICEYNLYAALLMRLNQPEQARNLLQGLGFMAEPNLVSLLLLATMEKSLIADQTQMVNYLIATRYPDYEKYINGV